ncbi:MAG: hypothetical protein Alpg2KO_23300 [Alphaproteobacteria bacterium]
MTSSPKLTQRSVRGKRGVSLLSYGLIVGLVSVVALVAVTGIGSNVNDLMSTVSDRLGGTAATGGSGGGSGATPTPSPSPAFAFTSHTFTACGAGPGPNGPLLADCQSAYSSTGWAGDTNNFNISSQGFQDFTVPETGTYRITSSGAQGANVGGRSGGNGAVVRADFSLTQGDTLTMVVGQTGLFGEDGAGGGGGSFVVLNNGGQPLLVGGGGGGAEAHSSDTNDGGSGQTTTAGGQETPNRTDNERGARDPGTNGAGGEAGRASGGGGWTGDGEHGCHTNASPGCSGSYTAGGGIAYGNGATGGIGSDLTDGSNGDLPFGGFGGGGMGSRHNGYGGGGGGYSGGVGGTFDGLETGGGGGGSYIATGAVNVATSDGEYENSSVFEGNPITTISANSGEGSVTVELLP